jgi:hypothetical protein
VLCRATLTGGTSGNTYDVVLVVVTTEGRTLEGVANEDKNAVFSTKGSGDIACTRIT